MRTPFVLLCWSLVFVLGCQAGPEDQLGPAPEIKNFTVGHWINRYPGDPDLAGVRVQQFPDCDGEAGPYEGRHPAMIIYVFKDGRANQIAYEPDGSVNGESWYTIKADDVLWETIEPVK